MASTSRYLGCTTYRNGKHNEAVMLIIRRVYHTVYLSVCSPWQDLSRLNRNLNKVVMIDDDSEYAEAQPENAIIVTRWEVPVLS